MGLMLGITAYMHDWLRHQTGYAIMPVCSPIHIMALTLRSTHRHYLSTYWIRHLHLAGSVADAPLQRHCICYCMSAISQCG